MFDIRNQIIKKTLLLVQITSRALFVSQRLFRKLFESFQIKFRIPWNLWMKVWLRKSFYFTRQCTDGIWLLQRFSAMTKGRWKSLKSFVNILECRKSEIRSLDCGHSIFFTNLLSISVHLIRLYLLSQVVPKYCFEQEPHQSS